MITTKRLRLRQWRDSDLPAYAALNADPRVMEFLGPVFTREESDAEAAKIRDYIDKDGWGYWAVEVIGGAPFIGFVGLVVPGFEAHFTPCMSIAWRLAYAHWGCGYTTEAAAAALKYAFEKLAVPEVVSYTYRGNQRSRRVMERLGMSRDSRDDYDHPRLAADDPMRPHVLYRLRNPQ
jgi:RimJ/RimL family protein N-acetyltransferase